MQCLEVNGAVRPLKWSLGVKGLKIVLRFPSALHITLSSVWLGFAIALRTHLRTDTPVQYTDTQQNHIFLVSLSP